MNTFIEDPSTPKGEHAWVGYYNRRGSLLFMITSKSNSRDLYYLYENENGKLKKLGKSKDPMDLCNKYNVYERITE